MLKKAKQESQSGAADTAKQLSQSVLASSRQIWLAGLGAFAKAQREGGKVFEALVKQGAEVESRTRDTAGAARETAKAKAMEVRAIAGGTWDKLEQVFEDRVAKALAKLGVHSSSDVERLTERVNALSESVNALLQSQGSTTPRQPATRGVKRAKTPVRAKTGRKSVASATTRKTSR